MQNACISAPIEFRDKLYSDLQSTYHELFDNTQQGVVLKTLNFHQQTTIKAKIQKCQNI